MSSQICRSKGRQSASLRLAWNIDPVFEKKKILGLVVHAFNPNDEAETGGFLSLNLAWSTYVVVYIWNYRPARATQ